MSSQTRRPQQLNESGLDMSTITREDVTPMADDAVEPRFSLFALACVLTDDPKRAEKLVRQTIARGDMSFSGPTRVQASDVSREFARRLYEAFREEEALELSKPIATGVRAADGMLQAVRALPEMQRVVFALCAFGGHTSAQAATLLGISAEESAAILDEALEALDEPD